MKSFVCEDATLEKAIKKAFEIAGKPEIFSVKLLDKGSKSILWWKNKACKIAFSYDIKDHSFSNNEQKNKNNKNKSSSFNSHENLNNSHHRDNNHFHENKNINNRSFDKIDRQEKNDKFDRSERNDRFEKKESFNRENFYNDRSENRSSRNFKSNNNDNYLNNRNNDREVFNKKENLNDKKMHEAFNDVDEFKLKESLPNNNLIKPNFNKEDLIEKNTEIIKENDFKQEIAFIRNWIFDIFKLLDVPQGNITVEINKFYITVKLDNTHKDPDISKIKNLYFNLSILLNETLRKNFKDYNSKSYKINII